MSGILDPKQRILDIIITQHGRTKLKNGEFNIRYISFSDSCIDYKPDRLLDNPDSDVSYKLVEPDGIQLEAFASGRDILFPEIDQTGGATSLDARIDNSFTVLKGKAYKKLGQSTSQNRFALVTGSVDFYSASNAVSNKSYLNYKNLQLIKSEENINNKFELSSRELIFQSNFNTTDSYPIEAIDPITLDTRFSNSLRLAYLPPVVNNQGSVQNIGIFPKYTEEFNNDYSTYINQQSKIWQNKSISIIKAKLSTLDIFGQIFEVDGAIVKKLVIAEAGLLEKNSVPVAKVFYLGHLHRDKHDILKFIRLFTMVARMRNV